MTENFLEPVRFENGIFSVNKEINLSTDVNICGPVSFLFSCSQKELKKSNEVKLPLPGMFQAIQMYFSIIENQNEYNRNIFKLDYLQEVIEKYIEAFFWLKEECGVNEITVSENLFGQRIFNSVVMQSFLEISKYFEGEILFQNKDLILTKFFLNLKNKIVIQKEAI